MAAPLIPLVLSGVRMLVPKASKEMLKRLAKSKGPQAALTAAKKVGQQASGAAGRKVKREAARGAGYTTKAGDKVVRQSAKNKAGERVMTGRMKKASPSQAKAGESMAKAGNRAALRRKAARAGVGGAATIAAMDAYESGKSPKASTKKDDKGMSAMESKRESKPVKSTSFSEAFAAARKEKGAGKTFMYKGKKYTTDRADDKPKTSSAKMAKKSTPTVPTKTSTTKKPTASGKRDKFLGMEIDKYTETDKQGNKVDPKERKLFGIGPKYKPMEVKQSDRKRGGKVAVKRKAGGSVGRKKAGCKRGMGKAQRGY